MTKVRRAALIGAACLVAGLPLPASAAGDGAMIGVNVVLDRPVSDTLLADLGAHGEVQDVVEQISAVTLRTRASKLADIRALPYVAAAGRDVERQAAPVDTVAVGDFSGGNSTWNLDALNVTVAPGSAARGVAYDGAGVYVAVLDSGLVDGWRRYFPKERMATQWAKAFSGGGGNRGAVVEVPNLWEHDQSSHGTAVTSAILGFSMNGRPIAGVAPRATVIPVKILDQTGFTWSSRLARGIAYVTGLKKSGALGTAPVVVNMSLGGNGLDPMEKAAIDDAIAHGVVVVAAAGNWGNAGMGYPAAYAPVISVAAAGWTGQFRPGADGDDSNWWEKEDVAEPTDVADLFIAGFSSRAKPGQDLDVSAPGEHVAAPYQTQSGKPEYAVLSGTSIAAPQVSGIAALMLQKNGALTQPAVEAFLEGSALPMGSGCRAYMLAPGADLTTQCWGGSAGDADGAGFVTADAAIAAIPH